MEILEATAATEMMLVEVEEEEEETEVVAEEEVAVATKTEEETEAIKAVKETKEAGINLEAATEMEVVEATTIEVVAVASL